MANRRSQDAMDRQENIIPRRKSGRQDQALSKTPVTLSKAVLESLFHLPLSEVAAHLGICATTIKKVSRRMGIEKWPYKTPKAGRKKTRVVAAEQSNSSAQAHPEAQLPAPQRDPLLQQQAPPARALDGQDQLNKMYNPAVQSRGLEGGPPLWSEYGQAPHHFEAADHFTYSMSSGSAGGNQGPFQPYGGFPGVPSGMGSNNPGGSPYNAAEMGWGWPQQQQQHGMKMALSMSSSRPHMLGGQPQQQQQQAPAARGMAYAEDRFSCNMKSFQAAMFRESDDGYGNVGEAMVDFRNVRDMRVGSDAGEALVDFRRPHKKEEEAFAHDFSFMQFKCSSA
mmetsp:Transcript_2251/g.5312  ORF Transcript_2251/g.5312 Transcript_2251/m.5312 type:complete len:337 (-) Transcript_2251:630-1640(-)|eukprot:CAMPEP_0206227266 /NCGR_PEP_ID=MMETSP0047_2-20121206/8533_1 /ASSEMBLY_ACC=CAM_ASM_000192 /TAXON_ID=195065 /ORGANISM="Chroomonas mesostigmatica_cf, Strain CCMP1168" /LENGTH=336 /DNA_ID=CAMNT_0053650409 /DNA_START=93 /DNA_END=1103 /DNA_ORIENTATION=+